MGDIFFNHSYVMKNLKSNICYNFSIGNIVYPSIVKNENIYDFLLSREKPLYWLITLNSN